MLKYKDLCKIYHDLSAIICTYFLIYSLNLIFWSSELVRTWFLIYSLDLTFWSSEYKETIIHILHSFLHFYTVVSYNGIWLFWFFDFFGFHKNVSISLTNIFIISHLIIVIFDLLTIILHPSHCFKIYHIPHKKYTMKIQEPKERLCNKYKNKEE